MRALSNFYEPELYDLALGEADDTAATIDFYRQALGVPPKKFLDIGAGTGRLAIPLVLAGHQAICIDSSRKMIRALREKLNTQKITKQVTLINAPFGLRKKHHEADIAIAPDDFLLHLLSANDLSSFFGDLRTWIPSGATFITDTRECDARLLQDYSHPPYPIKNYGLVRATNARPARAFYQTSVWKSYQPNNQRLTTHYRYEAINGQGKVTEVFHRVLEQRIHRNAEIISAARGSGFQLLKQCGRNTASRSSRQAIGGTLFFKSE